ncbi:hypothetical protein NQZ68_005269 [Dissostichus eleginoides]|nr:hypothetical protein NQZ68_005269 [Dissostichus eleginoides]
MSLLSEVDPKRGQAPVWLPDGLNPIDSFSSLPTGRLWSLCSTLPLKTLYRKVDVITLSVGLWVCVKERPVFRRETTLQ